VVARFIDCTLPTDLDVILKINLSAFSRFDLLDEIIYFPDL